MLGLRTWNRPRNTPSLAATLGVNSSTALRMVDRLEAGGLVDRWVNPGNRREVVLRLTEPGSDVVHAVLEHRHREITFLVSRLPAEVRSGLVVGLRALADVADDLAIAPSEPAAFRDLPVGGA
ncbi:MarR family winged helix-turn-helix transcriptional regulator [Streptomyces sp. NPDC056723]|uniref:MarR family winged helix-turn-helix transcriptional regulator n=1 Tax=Streptomyces sp. NPDC056723 TaxID=3345925 RepID=UPI00369C5CB5